MVPVKSPRDTTRVLPSKLSSTKVAHVHTKSDTQNKEKKIVPKLPLVNKVSHIKPALAKQIKEVTAIGEKSMARFEAVSNKVNAKRNNPVNTPSNKIVPTQTNTRTTIANENQCLFCKS